MRSQQGPSRHSTLCPVPHLVSLSASLRSAHARQNCYYRTRNPLTRGGGSDVCKTQKARTEIGRRLAYVCRRGNLGQEAALQRLCLRPRSTWRCKIQPHEIETRVAKAAQAGRSPEGLLPFYLLPSFGLQKAKDFMSPKEATPHPKRPLSAKDGTRFAQNMKKACRTRHAHAAESAPHDAQTRIGV